MKEKLERSKGKGWSRNTSKLELIIMIIYRLDGKVAKKGKWYILAENMNELNVMSRFFTLL